eukprot:gb/GEZJ01002651.1/.p1 GENE.gb/GEZJ01002651.1/~~gb/GEZJ01002651.1/.p1  ORF type:complete len:320 (+),score=20.64 gb/GEZJ01002651.1/:2674-3633(+)
MQQFLCGMQWLKTGVPDFATLVTPLHDLMETVYKASSKRTKSAAARINLATVGWNEKHAQAFKKCKDVLAHLITLSNRNEIQRLSVYTDASDTVWSSIIIQIPPEELKKPHMDPRHSPLAFCSGRFNNTKLSWSVLENEGYEILATLQRMHWLVATPAGFDLFTDHNNLVFIFDPLSIIPDLSQSSTRKLLRWAVGLSSYSYNCLHIQGPDNVWADLLTRWSAPSTVRRIVQVPALPSSSASDFESAITEIATRQDEHRSTRPNHVVLLDGVWKTAKNAIWIPDKSNEFHLRLCIIVHTGHSGHRNQLATFKVLQKHFS